MPSSNHRARAERPLVVGAGLVALDVIMPGPGSAAQLRAGGTCGNVLTILSYLGWRAAPLGRLLSDAAYRVVVSDLRRWNVDTRYLSLGAGVSTPIILELLESGPRGPKHRFLLTCPSCGSYFPRFRGITLEAMREIPIALRAPDVFFMDRLSPATISLAEEARERGALIVFEPASTGDLKQFRRVLKSVHFLKFSADRIPEAVIRDAPSVPLIVQTMGSRGLRYRAFGSQWKTLGAFPLHSIRDTVGAGDWCTAGILFALGRGAAKRIETLTDTEIYETLTVGQALGAWTCAYVGPRGGMYEKTYDEFWSSVQGFLKHRIPRVTRTRSGEFPAIADAALSCERCDVPFRVAVPS